MLKFLGGMFLMIGSVVGGGILAIPIVSVKIGFLTTLCFIIAAWLVMTKTGLYVLDLCLSCPKKYNSYYSIVGKFLGNKVQVLTTILFLWLLYFSLAAYISGCVSVIMSQLNLSHPLLNYFTISFAYVFLLGSLITLSTKITVRLNMILVTLKLGLLFIVIMTAYPAYAPFSLDNVSIMQTGAFSLLLITINAFGFQFIVPSLVSYYGRDNLKVFRYILVTSTTVVLILYIAWLFTIYSVIPIHGKHGLLSIYESNNQLLAFNTSLFIFLKSKWILSLLSIFEAVALFGSFFCVSLGLFDFLADVLKGKNRAVVGLMTYLPALLITVLSANIYIYAMTAAGYIAIILEIVIPIWAKRVRQKSENCDHTQYNTRLSRHKV